MKEIVHKSLIILFLWAFCPLLMPGQLPWVYPFGLPAQADEGVAVLPLNDGSYLCAGSSDSAGYDMVLMRLAPDGSPVWQRRYDAPLQEYTSALISLTDSTFVLAGSSYDPIGGGKKGVLLCTDSQGQLLWRRSYGDSLRSSYIKSLTVIGNGLTICGGISDGLAGNDSWVFSVGLNGEVLWTSPLRDSLSDVAQALIPDGNGGCWVAGDARQNTGIYQVYLAHLDAAGQVLDKQYIEGPNGGAQSLIRLSDGGMLLAGESYPDDASFYFDVLLVRFDGAGQELWRSYLGNEKAEVGFSVRETAEGQYLIAGYGYNYEMANIDALLMLADTGGQELWRRYYGANGPDYLYDLRLLAGGECIAAGFSGSGDNSQFLLVRDQWQMADAVEPGFSSQRLFPNPVSPRGRVYVGKRPFPEGYLLDMQGKTVARIQPAEGYFQMPDLPPGIYRLHFPSNPAIPAQKLRVNP